MSKCLIEIKANVRFSAKCTLVHTKNGKKAIPVPGPEGSRSLRLQEGGGIISPTFRSPLSPRKYSSFVLEIKSTQGPWCGRKNYFDDKF
jgi:hypothetical protein